MEITTQQKGKRAEFLVFGELIRRGADLYLPVVDIGVDTILRHKRKDGTYRYLEIQVKSTKAKEQAGYFNVYDLQPSDNLLIVCVNMSEEKIKQRGKPEIWILPSTEFEKYATGKEKRKHCRLPLPDRPRGENRTREQILEQYRANEHEEAWKLLTESPE